MELELSLGDYPAPAKAALTHASPPTSTPSAGEGHELVLELGVRSPKRAEKNNQNNIGTQPNQAIEREDDEGDKEDDGACPRDEPPGELSLSYPLIPSTAQKGSMSLEVCRRGIDVNAMPVDGGAATARSLSPSPMQVDVPMGQALDHEAAEDEENGGGGARKKLRLSKEQSAFLEDSFREHSTLSPEQKSNLANRLSLRPRQVEVWFQNRRARTKLKQTEVDCEYLKRCCETLTQENRRLQRELAELRAFRVYGHLSGVSTVPRVCPSCDNKATPYYSPPIVTTNARMSSAVAAPPSTASTLFARPYFGPFSSVQPVLRRQPSATS